MTAPLHYATAPRRNTLHWKPVRGTPEAFLSWLDLEHPADLKECGNYVAGKLRPTTVRHKPGEPDCQALHRRKEAVVSRSFLTLDADDARADLPDRVHALGIGGYLHPTWSSAPDALRLRICLWLSRDVNPTDYDRLVRAVVAELGAELGAEFDPGSIQAERYMFRPSTQHPEHYHAVARALDGEPLDVDAWLKRGEKSATPAKSSPVVDFTEPLPGDNEVAALEAELAAKVAPDYVARTVEGVLADLDALAAMSDGERDERGRGWDSGVFYRACQLVRAANSGTELTLDEAEALFFEHAPAAVKGVPGGNDYDPAHKWADAVSKVGGTPLRPKDASTVAEDFASELPASGTTSTGRPKGSSWERVDLSEVIDALLAGTLTRTVPTVGRLEGGTALFYLGKVNGIAGDSNAGKSFTAMLAAKQELEDGRYVLFIDYEDDGAGAATRFILDLGTDPEVVRDRLLYLNPRESLGDEGRAHLRQLLAEYQPTLAVIDSTGESMSTEGVKPNEDDETALWFQRLPRWIAEQGPAVVVIDHQTKADGGLWPIGSQRKRAAINGAQYVQSTVEAFDQRTSGRSKIVCAKDRLGSYATGKKVAEFRVDVDAAERFSLVATAGQDMSPVQDRDDLLDQLCQEMDRLHAEGRPLVSFSAVRDRVKGHGNNDIGDAFRELVAGGYVVPDDPAKARPRYRLHHRYVPHDLFDDLADTPERN